MDKVIIGGVYGSGKTTIIKKLCNQKDIGSFSYGEHLRRIAKEKGFIEHDSQYQSLTDGIRHEIILLCENILYKIVKDDLFKILLFDNHYSIIQGSKLIRTFSKEKIERYNKMILIESNVEEIEKRINSSDKIRASKGLSLSSIQEQIGFEKEIALELDRGVNTFCAWN